MQNHPQVRGTRSVPNRLRWELVSCLADNKWERPWRSKRLELLVLYQKHRICFFASCLVEKFRAFFRINRKLCAGMSQKPRT